MKKKLFLLITFALSLLAKEYKYLNTNQKELIELKKIQVKAAARKSKFSLITPLNVSASRSYNSSANSNDTSITTKYGITFNQDIFKFGGLYFAYKYADENQKLNQLNLNIQNDNLYLSLIKNIINIRINKLKKRQSEFKIENREYEIKQYREKYISGEIDISMLNNSILSRNSLHNTILQINNTISTLEYELKKLSSLDEQEITLPKFKKIEKKKYIQDNYILAKSLQESSVANYQHLATLSNYYPKISINASYGLQSYNNGTDDTLFSSDYTNQNYYSYGFSLSLPLDYANTFNTLEDTKVQYLQSKIDILESKIKISNNYNKYISNIKYYEDKIALSMQNVQMYKEMIELTQSEVNGGFKLKEDLLTIQNSKKVEELNIEIEKLNIKLELALAYYSILAIEKVNLSKTIKQEFYND